MLLRSRASTRTNSLRWSNGRMGAVWISPSSK
jgi:hypothetical protein